MDNFIRDIKHVVKVALGRDDRFWYLDRFERSISAGTLRNSAEVRAWADVATHRAADYEKPDLFLNSTDPLVRQGYQLREKVKKDFARKLAHMKDMRILLHTPTESSSPAGYSLFENMREALQWLGLTVDTLPFGSDTASKLNSFKPTVILSGDDDLFRKHIDWAALATYRRTHPLKVGLTASIAAYGNTPLKERLAWAKQNVIDFFYSFRDLAYVHSLPDYKPFFEAGYKIFSIPFGANPLVHYPVPGMKRDLDFAFIASTNKTKAVRYYRYLRPIVAQHDGYIDGPGWKHVTTFSWNRARDRYIYSRSKVGLNIHLAEQAHYANETNERTYQLAACGVPILSDHAKLLDKLFAPDELFVADSTRDFARLFAHILANPEDAQARALRAQRTVFEKYSTFHRAFEFVTELAKTLT